MVHWDYSVKVAAEGFLERQGEWRVRPEDYPTNSNDVCDATNNFIDGGLPNNTQPWMEWKDVYLDGTDTRRYHMWAAWAPLVCQG